MAEREARDWLRFAQDDLEAARFLMGMRPRKQEIICYHCQQCAEKAVKALYALEDMVNPRWHDFRALAVGLPASYMLSESGADFALLQPFAVAVRYPYEIELGPGDEEKAIEAAEAILGRCKVFVDR